MAVPQEAPLLPQLCWGEGAHLERGPGILRKPAEHFPQKNSHRRLASGALSHSQAFNPAKIFWAGNCISCILKFPEND